MDIKAITDEFELRSNSCPLYPLLTGLSPFLEMCELQQVGTVSQET